MEVCGEITSSGNPCNRAINKPGNKCWQHAKNMTENRPLSTEAGRRMTPLEDWDEFYEKHKKRINMITIGSLGVILIFFVVISIINFVE